MLYPLGHPNNLTPFHSRWALYGNLMSLAAKKVLCLHQKWPVFLPDFNQIWNFLYNFHEIPQHHISQQSVQCDLPWNMQADGQTHMMIVTGTFYSNVKATKTWNKKYTFAEAMNLLLYLWNTKCKQNCGAGISWNVVLHKTAGYG